jgi:D-arabinose 1-dehydrogenase-like Zn-dependent alcohol dehydrogenase
MFKIEIDPMITHTMPLPDINKALDLMHAGECSGFDVPTSLAASLL